MELRQLRYVEAVAAHRHFTRAAAAIGVAQPALSHQIRRLEDELGVPLFHRARGGIELTEAGRAFLPRIRRALAELAAGAEEISALRGLEAGRVRLGAMQALGGLDLPALIAAFHRAHPGVEVTLSEESTERMHELVLTERLDLAIVALELAPPAGLQSLALDREPVVLAVAARSPLADRPTVTMAQLRDEPFVSFRPGTGLRTTTDRTAAQAGFTARMAFETSNLDRLLALVAEGLGVSLVPASTIRAGGAGVRGVPFSPPLTRTVGVVWRADRRPAPGARAMLELLRAAVPGPGAGAPS